MSKKFNSKQLSKISGFPDITQIINNSPVLIFIWETGSGKWPPVFVSENVVNVLGYTPEEIVSGKVKSSAITFKEDLQKRSKTAGRFIAEGNYSWSLEYRLIAKSGNILWFRDNSQVHIGEEGKPDYIQSILMDITDLKETENKLFQTERYSLALINALPDLMFRMNREGIYLDYKAEKSELHYQEGSLIGRKNRDITPPEFADMIEGKVKATLDSKQLQQFEYKIYIKGKGMRDFAAFMVPSGDDEVVAIIRDNTDTNALTQAELKARTIMESTDNMKILVDLEGVVLDSNKQVTLLLGVQKDELIGERIFKFLPDSGKWEKFFLENVRYSNVPVLGDEFLFEKWLRYTFYPVLNEKGEAYWFAVYIVDITEQREAQNRLKESEHRFRSLFENMQDGFLLAEVIFDEAGNPVDAVHLETNAAFEAQSGLKADYVVGRKYLQLFPQIGKKELDKHIEVALTGVPVHYDYYLPDVNRYFNVNIFCPQHGQYAVIFNDITNSKLTETKIVKQNEELIKLNATRNKFFSIISHDLKSPFHVILGMVDLLIANLEKQVYDDASEYAKIIKTSSQSVFNLLQNLLVWSRSQTGRIKFNPVEIELNSFLDEIIAFSEINARVKSIKIKYSLIGADVIYADKEMINSIMRNLISNAIKYSYKSGRVTITAEKRECETLISVSDSGVGIDTETCEKIFTTGSSISTKGTFNEDGTGLGLILCKEFIDMHGGKISVESEEGKGSIFSFSLPVKRKEKREIEL